jgi:hypothetical protein
MDVWCLRLFCVCVVLCIGSGLATGWSLLQGVTPSVKMITELKKRPGPWMGWKSHCKRNIGSIPMTVAARLKPWTIFALSNSGFLGWNPTQRVDVCVRLFCVCVVLCVGGDLVMDWSPMYRIEKLNNGQGPTKDYRAIIILALIVVCFARVARLACSQPSTLRRHVPTQIS